MVHASASGDLILPVIGPSSDGREVALSTASSSKEGPVAFSRPFQVVAFLALMAALLLLYGLHPIAGWAALTLLGVGTIVVHRRRTSKVIAR